MPERGTLSIDKARRLLGFEPQWPLEKGFVRYIQWYRTWLPVTRSCSARRSRTW